MHSGREGEEDCNKTTSLCNAINREHAGCSNKPTPQDVRLPTYIPPRFILKNVSEKNLILFERKFFITLIIPHSSYTEKSCGN